MFLGSMKTIATKMPIIVVPHKVYLILTLVINACNAFKCFISAKKESYQVITKTSLLGKYTLLTRVTGRKEKKKKSWTNGCKKSLVVVREKIW